MAQQTITGGGAFTRQNIEDLNDNFDELYAGGSAQSFDNPTIEGTVSGGATYNGITITGAIGATGATIATAKLSGGTLTGAFGATGATLSGAALNGGSVTGAFGATGATFSGAVFVAPALGAATGTSINLTGNCRAGSYNVGAVAGATGGTFATIASITVVNGIVTAIS